MTVSAGSKVGFFLLGLCIGSLLGILLAPAPGEESREHLVGKAEESREYTHGSGKVPHE